ncbi:hypothetical protein H072_2629 [Dactylellina haptotyla CBS 200.50]|uniref:10 kDa heat shock protein, mitochondrial n=1 Tax=Dactylellina haptotyla (strain CBS 200.50) TaxID=1284197 RepID=S8AKE9_DACHA|nr:hypothetical protein H072_2629 [Dactylellina haptotyla CBS 200.50]
MQLKRRVGDDMKDPEEARGPAWEALGGRQKRSIERRGEDGQRGGKRGEEGEGAEVEVGDGDGRGEGEGEKRTATSIRTIKSLAPLLDRILVQRVRAETKTASGIFLPESSVEKLSEAKVLAVGPGGFDRDGKRLEVSVKPGDRVLIPQFGGSPVKVGEEEFHLFRDHELLAKINE